MTKRKTTSAPQKIALTGTQRQRRYRAARALSSIDLTPATRALLGVLRTRTGQSSEAVLAAALALLAASLDRPAAVPRPRPRLTRAAAQKPSPGDEIGQDLPVGSPRQDPLKPTRRTPGLARPVKGQTLLDL